ncbi:MAG: hypothetical protein Q7S76_04110 [bacterium]|nr:hypothetical protein [bacterium]
MKINRLYNDLERMELLADYFKLEALRVCRTAGSGHIGSACSSAEMLTMLYFGEILRYDPDYPKHPGRDRVLMRGHLGPLRYPIFAALGWMSRQHLSTYRKIGSILQGHESMTHVQGVDITPSGSLGMCLSYGVGAAWRLSETHPDATIYVFLGDGEEQEGNIAEAARHAVSLNLKNLVCILDWNGKQLSRGTSETEPFLNREQVWSGYGWDVLTIDGHSMSEIRNTLKLPHSRPLFVLANTTKGRGIEGCEEHSSGYHSFSTCPSNLLTEAIEILEIKVEKREQELNTSVNEIISECRERTPRPYSEYVPAKNCLSVLQQSTDAKDFDDVIRNGLKSLSLACKNSGQDLIILSADWSTKQQSLENGFYDPWVKFVDVGIREQHMAAMAHGISVTDPQANVVVFDGDAFVYRFADQIHATAQSGIPVVFLTTDAGLCEARNGSTHQSEGQPAAMITMPGLRFFEPADETDFYVCLNRALAERSRPSFIRTHSSTIQKLQGARSGAAYLCHGNTTKVARLNVVSSGCTVMHAVTAAQEITLENSFEIRVINVLEPVSIDATFTDLLDINAPVLVVYNGNPVALSSVVSRAILMHVHDFRGRFHEHGFVHGTTGAMTDVFAHFELDVTGIKHKMLNCING